MTLFLIVKITYFLFDSLKIVGRIKINLNRARVKIIY